MIVAIHAFENTYQGLHGIETHLIVEVNDLQEAEMIAEEESVNVMNSCSDIIQGFYDDAEAEGLQESEFDDYVDDCIQGNIGYQIWEVIPYDHIIEMEYDFYNNMDEFIKEHCREAE